MSFGQQVEILAQSHTLLKTQHQDFIYLSDSTNLDQAVFVAQIKAIGSLKNTSYLYYFIKNKAQELGANAFRLDKFNPLEHEKGELILSTYYATDELFSTNANYLPQNTLFLFGYDDLSSRNEQHYKINGEKYTIGAGEYRPYVLQEGKEYKINKGGFTGMTFWIKGKPNGDNSFLSFSGIGLNTADYALYSNGLGISINTGKINTVDPNLALLLLKLYREKK